MATAAFSIPPELDQDIRRWRGRFLITGGAALLLCVIGAFFTPDQFFRSYLWSYMFYIGVSLGCMALVMLQFLTGGAWGLVIRRLCESAARTLPLLALLFLPIAIGIPRLYEWSHADVVARDEILKHKSLYLNVPFFLIRAGIYFTGWVVFSYFLNKWSLEQDQGRPAARRLQLISGPGLVFWGFSVTFMAVDWVLSLDPHWFSTIFGLLFMAGQGLSSLSFLIALVVFLSGRRPFSELITARHLHDLGKLLLAFVMVWAYFSFSQFLIIWSGNLVEEIPWYLQRLRGGWQYVAMALVLGHFALPFALLLSRDLKRNFRLLAGVAVFILIMRLVDLYWLVAPDFLKGSFGLSWMDFLAPIGLGGVWLAFFTFQLTRRPLLPAGDPHLEEALAHGRD